MSYDAIYLSLLYVLSAVGTFIHIYITAKIKRVRFRPFFALIVSVFWFVFFIYLVKVEFSK